MSKLIEQLKSAGLESEDCPMLDCYGQLNFIESEGFFKCSICGEIFPLFKTVKKWSHKETNAILRSIVQQWEDEERTMCDEELLEDSESDHEMFWLGDI